MVARDGVEPPTPTFSGFFGPKPLFNQQLNSSRWPCYCDHSVTSADVRLNVGSGTSSIKAKMMKMCCSGAVQLIAAVTAPGGEDGHCLNRVCKSRLPNLRKKLHSSYLFNPAETIEKLLRCPNWCLVQFRGATEQLEANAKFLMQ